MKNYTVSQKILSIGATYEIFEGNASEPKMIIKGKVLSFTPKLEAYKDEESLAKMTGNFFKTKFEVEDASGNNVASISFPFFNFVKGFTLETGGNTYDAKGGFFAWKFTCTDSTGNDVITIAKEVSLKDKFQVNLAENLDEIVGLMSAVCIDQRYFQD